MAALFYKDEVVDPSLKAEAVLDYVLQDNSKEALAEKEVATSVVEELHQAPLVPNTATREKSRVLFITRDIHVLREHSVQQLQLQNISEAFAEIHIIVLSNASQAKKGVVRLGTNIWAYTTSVRYFWMQPFAALKVAQSQLYFGDGFRPDIVVAQDPFESGISGLFIAHKYDREFQVQVLEDFFLPAFKEMESNNTWRLKMASYVLKRTVSIRAATTTIKEKIQKKFKHTKDVMVLPKHYDIQALTTASLSATSVDSFPQFSFVVLFVGVLNTESTLFRAIDASRSVLHSKSIGLVVVGEGTAKNEFQKRAEILGIQEQVLFVKDQSQLPSYMQSADILLCTDTTDLSDEVVIKAAAIGLPVLAAETPLRSDLFTDGTDAFLCPKEDTVCFSQKLVKFLNTNALRVEFSENAKNVVKTRLHEDPQAFKTAYRDSIEGVFSHT